MEFFGKIVNEQKLLATFAKSFILDVWQGSECTFENIVLIYSFSEYHQNFLQNKTIGPKIFHLGV